MSIDLFAHSTTQKIYFWKFSDFLDSSSGRSEFLKKKKKNSFSGILNRVSKHTTTLRLYLTAFWPKRASYFCFYYWFSFSQFLFHFFFCQFVVSHLLIRALVNSLWFFSFTYHNFFSPLEFFFVSSVSFWLWFFQFTFVFPLYLLLLSRGARLTSLSR